MKAGTVFRSFVAKDGRAVVLGAPRWSDLDDMLEFVNSLVDEGVDIAVDKKVTREEEVDWLARHMTVIEKDEEMVVAAEVDGRFVGTHTKRVRIGVFIVSIAAMCERKDKKRREQKTGNMCVR